MSLGGSFEFQVMIIAVVAYVLDAMNQIIEVRHLMQERSCQLEDGSIKVLGAEIDFPILRTAGVPYLVDTAPAIRPAPSVRGYMRNYRMDLAASLLTQTDEPITVIAGKVGYTNTSKFSEAFKKVKGKTPLEYRKIKI